MSYNTDCKDSPALFLVDLHLTAEFKSTYMQANTS